MRRRSPALVVSFARGARKSALLAGLGTVGWYYARRVHDDAFRVSPTSDPMDLSIESVGTDSIALRESGGNAKPCGIWGVESAGGYGQVGAVLDEHGPLVTRVFAPLAGEIQPGEPARLDNFAFPHDPQRALGLAYRLVRIPSEAGPFPAWQLPGQGDTWLILVHGKGSERAEALRLLSGLGGGRPPALAITYRNDVEAPAGLRQRYAYGRDEWPDLEAAVRFAQTQGATRTVLVGYSMGGAIVAHFMSHSALAGMVAGLVLEAPMLDFNAVLDHAARQRHVPGAVTEVARTILRRRYGIDCDEFNCRELLAQIEVPLLLIHGDADSLVPVTSSDRVAQDHGERLVYHRVPGAHHVGAWNLDPSGYADVVRNFLGTIPGVRAPGPNERATPRVSG